MRICVAQARPVRGDIQANIENHKKLIDLAISCDAGMVIFPELSITGYEPSLAGELATTADDHRFDGFQKLADAEGITIGIGAPIKSDAGITISMVLFQPNKRRQIYTKKYIHQDEEEFFVSGRGGGLMGPNGDIALAICYEISIPEHAEEASKAGAEIYIASVAKSVAQVDKAHERLSEIAKTYSMTVLMANCVGHCDNFECGGRSAIWNNKGHLLDQLEVTSEGILLVDTNTNEIVKRHIMKEK
jgi:predicted amidohydrolase